MKNLLIITGAGASFDVVHPDIACVDISFKPPLTKNLFDKDYCPHIRECLRRNPVASQVGNLYQLRYGNGELEKGLESYLLELKDNNKPTLKKQYWAIPIYLYDIFQKISESYLETGMGLPSNYRHLIDEIIKNDYELVVWINLNYDLLVDFTSVQIRGITSAETVF